jgi:hypothetical protein
MRSSAAFLAVRSTPRGYRADGPGNGQGTETNFRESR